MLRLLEASEFDAYIGFAYELALDLTRSGYPTYCDGIKTREGFIERTRKSLDRPGEDVLLFVEDGQAEGLIAFQHLEEDRYLHAFVFNIRRDTGTALAEFVDYCRERWPGFELDLGFPVENVEAVSWLEGAGIPCIERSWNYQLFLDGYPDIGGLCDPSTLPDAEPGHRVFRVNSIFGLRLLELALYFQQDKQRIARCDYCWGWFVPKTKKVTRYCDRVTDGFPCKQRGSRFKRNLVEEQDGALRICNQLRDRMYARFLRWQDAVPSERDNLIPMDYDQYTEWSENARLARMEYLDGKLTAEEFLRRIDTTHELESYEASKAELMEETVWQNRVAGDFSFDSEKYYPEAMQVLDLGATEPKWELRTADDLRREDQKGHQSLREKYGTR